MNAGCAIRRVGSGALGLADVAAGRSEAYCELHINAWDCAAGILLVREAGGHTNDFFADEGLLSGNPVIATNDALCAKLAGVIGIPMTTCPEEERWTGATGSLGSSSHSGSPRR
jgi:myo-inositol-1(or 4)-monophosphatase